MNGPQLPRATVLSLVLSAFACSSPGDGGIRPQDALQRPVPTPGSREGELDRESDERRQEEREAWIEEMHRVGPGTDWRAIERSNRAQALRRRNRRVSGATGVGPGGLSEVGGGPLPVNPWEEIGSRNQAGHVRCAAIGHEIDGVRKLYVGSALGGLWRGNLDGTEWRPLSDSIWGGVDEVAVLPPEGPGQPEVLLMRRGTLVYRSDDDGASWATATGLSSQTSIRRMAVLDDAAHTVVLFGNRNTGGGEKTCVVASTDGGRSFAERWVSVTLSTSDMWVPQTGSGAADTLYTIHKGRIRRSTDGGMTFALQGVIDTSATEGTITGSEAGGPTLYTTLRVGGQWNLYRSDDGGVTSQLVQSALTDYWGALHAFPSNPMAVVWGGVEAHRSFDGGLSETIVNSWGAYYGNKVDNLHADIRGIDVLPDPDGSTQDYGFFCTDGGLYVTRDSAQSVLNLTLIGLGVGQFYSTHSSSVNPDRILGGTQDQGYQRGIRQPSTGPWPSTPLNQLISGDYGHLTSGDGSHSLVYSTYPGFILIQEGETGPVLRTEDFPVGTNNLWLPPVVADPLDNSAFFFLGRELYHYVRTGPNNWAPSQHSAQSFTGPGSYLSAMAFAPTDPQRVYAVNNVGRLWSSVDHGVTWTESADSGGDSHYFYGNALAVHPTNPLEAVVGGSGYSEPGVRRTTDGGATWQPLVDGLPLTLTYDLTYAGDGSGDLFAATEIGAFQWRRDLGVWVDIMGNDAPSTLYWSVEAVPGSGRIRYGTYGRGIWDYELTPLAPLTRGVATSFGLGLGRANVLHLDTVSEPRSGGAMEFDVTGGAPGRTAWLFQGRRQAARPFAGGALLVATERSGAVARGTFDADGGLLLSTRLPDGLSSGGTPLGFQVVARDPRFPLGLAFSNGVRVDLAP